jgi:hypothetical protein
MNEQDRYWTFFVQTYGHSSYLAKYLEKCDRIDRIIAIVTAITSSASIAGWAIWQHLAGVWGCFIAFSQVIAAIKIYLPYSKQAEMLREAERSFVHLATRVEGQWFEVNSDSLTEKQVHEILYKFQLEKQEVESKLFAKVTLPLDKKLLDEASRATDDYFARYYGSGKAKSIPQ